MFLDFFLKGMVLSVYIVVPIGAISILYIKRTLQKGVSSGIASALGVTTVEGFYAACAIFGLTVVSDFLIKWKFWFEIFGTTFLVILGLKILLSENEIKIKPANKTNNFLKDYISMVLFTLLNPLTIVGFIAIFVSFGIGDIDKNLYHSLTILFGFIFSSFFYCILLITITSIIKAKFLTDDAVLIQTISKISGLVIILFTISAFILSFIDHGSSTNI